MDPVIYMIVAPVDSKDLIGQSRAKVLQLLGEPQRKERGDYWWSDEEADMVKILDGGKRLPIGYYGPFPKNIPFGTPYDIWSYQEVYRPGCQPVPPDAPVDDSEIWDIYFIEDRVVDVLAMSSGEIY